MCVPSVNDGRTWTKAFLISVIYILHLITARNDGKINYHFISGLHLINSKIATQKIATVWDTVKSNVRNTQV